MSRSISGDEGDYSLAIRYPRSRWLAMDSGKQSELEPNLYAWVFPDRWVASQKCMTYEVRIIFTSGKRGSDRARRESSYCTKLTSVDIPQVPPRGVDRIYYVYMSLKQIEVL